VGPRLILPFDRSGPPDAGQEHLPGNDDPSAGLAVVGTRSLPIVRGGLLEIAVGAGLQMMTAMMATDVQALCGPRGRHDPDLPRRAMTARTDGMVTSSGSRSAGRRVRAVDGSGELPVASYEVFTGTEVLRHRAMPQMLVGRPAVTAPAARAEPVSR